MALLKKGFAGQDRTDGSRIRVRKNTFLLTASADKPEEPDTETSKILHRGHEALVWRDTDFIGSTCIGWEPRRMFAAKDGVDISPSLQSAPTDLFSKTSQQISS